MAFVRVNLSTGQQQMDVDEYVKSVVPAEMATGWPVEALKAQAVASKSYAVSEGVVDTTDRSQVYNPAKRAADSDAAVEAVRGIYMAFGGRIVTTFFFASCPGQTRTPSQATWAASSDRPFLQPVQCECGFKAYDGHGIGMCQQGARAMANKGFSFDQILRHYYTGIEFVHEDLTPVTSLGLPGIQTSTPVGTTTQLQAYTVQPGDTLGTIAQKFHVDWGIIFEANRALIADPNRIEKGWVLQIPAGVVVAPGSGQTYVVVSGDSLSKLAQAWGCSADAIAALNGIVDINRIEVGQVLKRP